jgi:hypothetical protein
VNLLFRDRPLVLGDYETAVSSKQKEYDGGSIMKDLSTKARGFGFVPALLCVLICRSIILTAQTGPLNLNFEEGKPGQIPNQWIFPSASAQSGYSVSLTSENPKSGALCAVIKREGEAKQPGFGNLMQSVDAASFRMKRVRFRAAVRTEVPGFAGRAQLWLRVDRPNQQMGFFDNMGDRPITESHWNYYEIIGDIEQDAERINIGLMLLGDGKAWLDDVSFEVVGDAEKPITEPARPLTGRGLANLVAFSRLLGYVRHFHPSDEAAQTNWEDFAIEGMRAVEEAGDSSELANKLESLFRPVAPTVQVFPAGNPPSVVRQSAPPNAKGQLKVIKWNHRGFGTGNPQSAYRSERTITNAPEGKFPESLVSFQQPYRADLGGGVSCYVPLALFTDESGTWPNGSLVKNESSSPQPRKKNYSAGDRATRLAAVALAWNVFQHFYPYFDVVKTDWPGALTAALNSAATDQNERAFLDTLRRLVAALHDGHGRVSNASIMNSAFVPSIAWDWIEDRLVVTYVKDPGRGLSPGDVVIAINGEPTAKALAETESLISGATSQWIRYRALQELALGGKDQPLVLTIEPWANPGKHSEVSLKRDTQIGKIQEPRPAKIAELEPGIFYVKLDQVQDRDFTDALPKLATARGIVFDMRGYPTLQNPMLFFSHLSEKAMTSAQWHIPIISFPDQKQMRFQRGMEWQIGPAAPYLKAKKAFITDGRAISYGESCMGIVENYRLGEIVGGPTAGTNGNVNPITLPGGYTVTWTGMKVLKHDGSQHHGVGIQPTIPVSRTRAGVAAGRDELLERAIRAVR